MTNQPKCNSHPMCSHNTNGRDMKKPCSISVGITTQEKIQALTDKIDELLGIEKGSWESISTPILAHDILRAFPVELEIKHEPGSIWIRIKNSQSKKDWAVIDLSKPLHEQSEQNIAELYKLFFE